MRYQGNFGSVYFFYEKILSVKKNTKTENKRFSPSLKFLCSQKIVAFVVFYSLIFVLLLGFCLWRVLLRSKSFRKKNKNKQAQNCPDSLIYNTTFSCQKLTQTWEYAFDHHVQSCSPSTFSKQKTPYELLSYTNTPVLNIFRTFLGKYRW